MRRLDVQAYISGPECSEVIVITANGTRARAEHPERFHPESLHFMPFDRPLWIYLPFPLGPRAAEFLAKCKVADACTGKKTTMYSEPGILGRWLRITHPSSDAP